MWSGSRGSLGSYDSGGAYGPDGLKNALMV
jgi:hypothetical protein